MSSYLPLVRFLGIILAIMGRKTVPDDTFVPENPANLDEPHQHRLPSHMKIETSIARFAVRGNYSNRRTGST